MERVDLLGRPLTATETQVLDSYTRLKALSAAPGVAPCVERNVKSALACMWQVVNDLDLVFEQLYDVGV